MLTGHRLSVYLCRLSPFVLRIRSPVALAKSKSQRGAESGVGKFSVFHAFLLSVPAQGRR